MLWSDVGRKRDLLDTQSSQGSQAVERIAIDN